MSFNLQPLEPVAMDDGRRGSVVDLVHHGLNATVDQDLDPALLIVILHQIAQVSHRLALVSTPSVLHTLALVRLSVPTFDHMLSGLALLPPPGVDDAPLADDAGSAPYTRRAFRFLAMIHAFNGVGGVDIICNVELIVIAWGCGTI